MTDLGVRVAAIVVLGCTSAQGQSLGPFDRGRAGTVEASFGGTYAEAEGHRASYAAAPEPFRDQAGMLELALRTWVSRGSWVAIRLPVVVASSGAAASRSGEVSGGELRNRVLGWSIDALASGAGASLRYGGTLEALGPNRGDSHRFFGLALGGFAITRTRPAVFVAISAFASGSEHECDARETDAMIAHVGAAGSIGRLTFWAAPRLEAAQEGPTWIPGGELTASWSVIDAIAVTIRGQARHIESSFWGGWEGDLGLSLSYAAAARPGARAGAMLPRYRPVPLADQFRGCD